MKNESQVDFLASLLQIPALGERFYGLGGSTHAPFSSERVEHKSKVVYEGRVGLEEIGPGGGMESTSVRGEMREKSSLRR